jgi:predicted HicB family RNase H-like nuclease
MPSEAQKRAAKKWTQANMKRIPLDVRKDYYTEILLPAARKAGESVNGYIKKAIADRINKEQTGGE